MKGTIGTCLQELIKSKYGVDIWGKILKKSNLPENTVFFAHHDVKDESVNELLSNTCQELNQTMEEFADVFGEYWMEYASKNYFAYFHKGKSAKEFLLRIDQVHVKLTNNIENANPPRFDYETVDDDTFIMTYKSTRKLEKIWIGLIKGVGKYFNENIELQRLTENKVKLKFS